MNWQKKETRFLVFLGWSVAALPQGSNAVYLAGHGQEASGVS
jgi:hypothetical protein